MRIVADTNVLLSGLLWRGNSSRIIDACRSGELTLITSAEIIAELGDVLSRPKPASRLSLLSLRASDVLMDLADFALWVTPTPLDIRVCRDVDDDVILATAITGNADVIITGDSDLISLQSFRGILIVTPAAYVTQLKE